MHLQLRAAHHHDHPACAHTHTCARACGRWEGSNEAEASTWWPVEERPRISSSAPPTTMITLRVHTHTHARARVAARWAGSYEAEASTCWPALDQPCPTLQTNAPPQN